MGYQGLSPDRVRDFADTLRSAANRLENQAVTVRTGLSISDLQSDVFVRLDERADFFRTVANSLTMRAAVAENAGLQLEPTDVFSFANRLLAQHQPEASPAPRAADRRRLDRGPVSTPLADTDGLPPDPGIDSRKRVREAVEFIQPLVHLEQRFYHDFVNHTLRVEESDAAKIRDVISDLTSDELDDVVTQLSDEEQEDFWFAVTGGLDTRVRPSVANTATVDGTTLERAESDRRVRDGTRLLTEAIQGDKDRIAHPIWDPSPTEETELWVWRILNTLTPTEQDAVIAQIQADDQLEFVLPNVPHRPTNLTE